VRYAEFPPPPDLADRVRLFWIVEHTGARPGDAPDRVLPDGCMELVLHWGAPYDTDTSGTGFAPQPRAVLVGQIRRALLLRATGGVGMLGARLQPWAGGCVRGTSPAELATRVAELGELWGDDARALPEQLAAAPDDLARVALVTALLRRELRPLDDVDRELALCVTRIERSAGATRVGELARASHQSTRQLQRRFAARVGLTPKRLARIARLQALSARLDARPDVSLAQLAPALGYADQPHLAREISELVGVSLRAWRRESQALAGCFRGERRD